MGRETGIIVLVVGAILIYSLAFTQFDQRVSRFTINDKGERVPVTHVTCPSPWAVVAQGAEPDVIAGESICPRPARTLLLEGALVALISLIVGIWGLTRSRPTPLPELPRSLQRMWRERVWRSRN